jgi:hypothetical protein
MSEKLNPSTELKTEQLDISAESEANMKRLQELARKSAEHNTEGLTGLEAQAKAEAISGKEITIGEREAAPQTPLGMQKELKNTAYARSMERIRSNLPRPQRTFSKLIHQPLVNTTSNTLAATVARPSGILGGGIFALVGSLVLLYFARRYGFAYNYMLFAFLYIGGYLLGLCIEAIYRLFRR